MSMGIPVKEKTSSSEQGNQTALPNKCEDGNDTAYQGDNEQDVPVGNNQKPKGKLVTTHHGLAKKGQKG